MPLPPAGRDVSSGASPFSILHVAQCLAQVARFQCSEATSVGLSIHRPQQREVSEQVKGQLRCYRPSLRAMKPLEGGFEEGVVAHSHCEKTLCGSIDLSLFADFVF